MDRSNKAQSKRIVVGMSGGVDSSVTAWLLKQQGHEVVGLFMKNWEGDDDDEYCSARQDWLDAASVADLIGVDIEAVNFSAEYKDRVFAEFLREYQAGRTPNPDVLCNAEIKFRAFLDHAMTLGADLIATGHYARVRPSPTVQGEFELLKGLDSSKDQSYFLHRLTQEQLSKACFPLGDLPKTRVREIAHDLGLPNAAKKDSTGICFIGERPFREFLNQYLPTDPGPILSTDGVKVGEHHGLAFYTLGQRKGLGIGGVKQYQHADGSGPTWYVAKKDMANNTLYVVPEHDHPWLLSTALIADQASWVAGRTPDADRSYGVKTRYRQADARATLTQAAADGFGLHFEQAQWAVTPGQSAVLYDGDVCLGGGIITARQP
ncbi:MAG: tRNA 2-thiouridine(34) synthase MnmA [Burkholderiaceae bacterium]|nr:tRNA 2-thiouridine(34) synthase MnmA [Burkholderiaceae bacterium]MCD8518084.1 tRNA 2-thiouridine(34) synthase MnmA [Burkholderiaceae bacterium]MCD8537019.1 tRNA 2-thiouridine(34) synthase MnmA [Burkholderiaceae bacterium]MCD8565114.1 tRNA 2-thiouridine(34) synthase MnmA [Burkholderiaceae bacterium]